MRQEHKFCAEVYHRMHDQIDHSKRVLFCLDGEAADEAAKYGQVECACVPDLCFTLKRSEKELRIEAKIIENRRIKAGKGQRLNWCRSGAGKMQPHMWIGCDEAMKKFWLWDHDPFRDALEKKKDGQTPILIFDATSAPAGVTIDELIKLILDRAKSMNLAANENEPAEKSDVA